MTGPGVPESSRTKTRERVAALRPFVAPGLLALLLVLPGFVYPYLFDDFQFLVRGLRFTPASLLPDPAVVFYRPVSRDLYFGLIRALPSNGALFGHVLNTLILLAATCFVVDAGTRCFGRREGALSGLYFAGLGQIPLLVAWISGAQDALAIAFTAAAISFECRRRHWVAVAVCALALFSKETAAAAIPALAILHLHIRRGEKGARGGAFDYLILGILWAAVHPGIHLLARRGFGAVRNAYVGLGQADGVTGLFRYVTLFFNLPSPGHAVDWPMGLTPVALVAAVVALAGVLVLPAITPKPAPRGERGASGRVGFLLVGLLLAVAPLGATAFLVRNWAPYYIAFPAIGAALLAGAFTARAPRRLLLVAVPLYVLLGIYVRGMVADPRVTTERNLAPAASALLRLEAQFKALEPSLPPGAQVLVASQVQGSASVYVHLYTLPTLAQWYRDPSLRVTRPEMREAGLRDEFLFWINANCDLFQVDRRTLQLRSTASAANREEYVALMRAYARGLSESGELDRAVRVLLSLPERSEDARWLDRRIAASLLAGWGRMDDAQSLLGGAPAVDPRVASEYVTELLWQPVRGERYDEATLWAFGLDGRDPNSWRGVMRKFAMVGNRAAVRFATRLLTLRPGDPEARQVLRAFPSDVSGDVLAPGGPPFRAPR